MRGMTSKGPKSIRPRGAAARAFRLSRKAGISVIFASQDGENPGNPGLFDHIFVENPGKPPFSL
jgi:hypothetical protein